MASQNEEGNKGKGKIRSARLGAVLGLREAPARSSPNDLANASSNSVFSAPQGDVNGNKVRKSSKKTWKPPPKKIAYPTRRSLSPPEAPRRSDLSCFLSPRKRSTIPQEVYAVKKEISSLASYFRGVTERRVEGAYKCLRSFRTEMRVRNSRRHPRATRSRWPSTHTTMQIQW